MQDQPQKLSQEERDRLNPYWRPEWKRRQKRTTQRSSLPPSQPLDVSRGKGETKKGNGGVQDLALSNSSISKKDYDLIPPTPKSLLLDMIQYFNDNPEKMLPSDFFIENGISEAIFETFDETVLNTPEIRNLQKRAQEICENRIVNCALRSHTNPATTIFLLKNKFGYVDKTESKTEVSGSQKIEITFKMPLPEPPPKQDSPKVLEPGKSPYSAPNALEIEAKPISESGHNKNEAEK